MSSSSIVKVVVRLLPPMITEEEFLNSIPPNLLKNTIGKSFIPGQRSSNFLNNFVGSQPTQIQNARCYFYFKNSFSASEFIKTYHGTSIVDERGLSYRAVCGVAPFQKVPKIIKKIEQNFDKVGS